MCPPLAWLKLFHPPFVGVKLHLPPSRFVAPPPPVISDQSLNVGSLKCQFNKFLPWDFLKVIHGPPVFYFPVVTVHCNNTNSFRCNIILNSPPALVLVLLRVVPANIQLKGLSRLDYTSQRSVAFVKKACQCYQVYHDPV